MDAVAGYVGSHFLYKIAIFCSQFVHVYKIKYVKNYEE